jgi:hypothetical protein
VGGGVQVVMSQIYVIKGPFGGCEQTGAVEPVKMQRSEVTALWLARDSTFSDIQTKLRRGRSQEGAVPGGGSSSHKLKTQYVILRTATFL